MAKVKKEKKKKTSKKSGSKKGAIIIIIIAILISIATIIMTKLVLWPRYQDYKANKKKAQVEQIDPSKKEVGDIYEMDSFTVNTYQSAGRRFAKIKVSLATSDSDVISELEKRNPQIRDLLIKYYRSKTVADLTHPSFSDSSAAVLVEQINDIISTGKVTHLFYQELLIQ